MLIVLIYLFSPLPSALADTNSVDSGPTDIKFGMMWPGQFGHEQNADLPMAPASVMKVITASTSLRVLRHGDQDFQFKNSFDGKFDPDTHILSEPVFTISGDPTWGNEDYGEGLLDRINKVIAELKKNGIQKVSGAIQITTSGRQDLERFQRQKLWKESWLKDCDMGMVTEFMLNQNCGIYEVKSASEGVWRTAGVSVPVTVNLNPGQSTSLTVTPVQNDLGRIIQYKITGSFATGKTEYLNLPVHQGAKWLKNLFQGALKTAGILHINANAGETGTKALHVDLSSLPLKKILPPFLQKSLNIIGDRLFVENNYALGISDPLANASMLTLHQVLGSDAGLLKDFLIYDGSGLVPEDRVTARAMYLFLQKLMTETYFVELVKALPESGGPVGTLRSRLTGVYTKGKVFAKTGSLSGVSNLAGYFHAANGSYEPFTVFTEYQYSSGSEATEDQMMHQKIDALVVAFAQQNP